MFFSVRARVALFSGELLFVGFISSKPVFKLEKSEFGLNCQPSSD
jgi:hypothetical protein